jgi:hypothetical protein
LERLGYHPTSWTKLDMFFALHFEKPLGRLLIQMDYVVFLELFSQ